MKFAPRCLFAVPAAFAALTLGGATLPAFAADPPPAVKPAPPADTKSTPIRFTLQLLRLDDAINATIETPLTKPEGATVTQTVNLPPTQKTLASPIMTTLDGSTATIAVVGDDLSYTISLSPAIAANGKILTLWNLRLNGKSLPGATAVTATGATKVDAGKPAIIAEVSLTDPANGHRATFILQGTTLTGDAATDTAPPAIPTPAPVAPPTIAPATT